MITGDVAALLLLAIVTGVGAIILLVFGICTFIIDKEVWFFIGLILCFLALSGLSGVVFFGTYQEYQDAIPQNQVKILKQKIIDAEKQYQKYLIDHPELKEEIRYDDCPKSK